MPINYQLGKIYKLECNITGLIYIGSTCEKTLARRLTNHVRNFKKHLNGKYGFVTSFKILENEDYVITLLEKYPCDSKDELLARERYWTNEIDCVNKCKPGLLNELGIVEYNKQYYEDNKPTILLKQKKYRQDNKEHINLQQKQKHVCECGGCYTTCHKLQHLNTKKHQEYIENKKWYIMSKGFDLIKKLDNYFNQL